MDANIEFENLMGEIIDDLQNSPPDRKEALDKILESYVHIIMAIALCPPEEFKTAFDSLKPSCFQKMIELGILFGPGLIDLIQVLTKASAEEKQNTH